MVMSAFEKKDPGKFTVRFNMADPQQKAVIDLLNQQGRYKAQFLTSAILHYVHCPETPDIRSAAAVDSTEIERIVRHVLAQQQTAAPSALRQGGQEPGEAVVPWEEPDSSLPNTRNPAEDADKAAILQTLDAFRKQ